MKEGHMDKTKGEWTQGREVRMAGVGGGGQRKRQTTALEQ